MASNWELRIKQVGQQSRAARQRTAGTYQVFHDGLPIAALSGACFETRVPGDNSKASNNRYFEAGSYRLSTEDGQKYCAIGYTGNTNPVALRRPSLLLRDTGKRVGILLHPARGFLSSAGCSNPSKPLHDAESNMDFIDSRNRAIAIVDDLKSYLGAAFPKQNGHPIPNATILIS